MSDHFGNIPIQPPESTPPGKKPTKPTPRTPTVSTSKRKGRSPSKGLGWVAAVVIIAVCYCVLGFFGVPYYVSTIFPNHFQNKTGLVLVPSTVAFNPFTFRFETGELRVLSESGATILSLQSLLANVAPVSLLRLNLVCNTVTVNKLDLNLTRELDGSYNFQQIFGAKKDSKPSDLFNFNNLPFFLSLNNISITNSRITFNDAPAGKVHTVENIQLDLPTFSNIPFQTDQYLRPHFSAIINGSPVELTGQARLGESDGKEQATKLSLDIHDLDLTIYSGYLPFSLPMEFKKGRANGKLDLLFDPQNKSGDKLSIGFQLLISAAELTRENETIVIVVPTAQLNGNLQPVSKTLHFTEIAVKEPTVSSFGKSFLENLKQPEKQKEKATAPHLTSVAVAPYSMAIDLFLVDKGSVQFFPEQKDEKPASTWNSIQLSVKNYRSAPENLNNQSGGSFSLAGEKDGSSSSFSWQGTFTSTGDLTGSLTLLKMDGEDLFKSIDSDLPVKVKGIADLKGQLSLYSKKDLQSHLGFKLADTDISIENFVLTDNEKNLLSAPLAKFTSLSLQDKFINFGNVHLPEGIAQFNYGRIPKFFTTFNSKKYQLQGIDFEGKVTFNPTDKTGQTFKLTDVALKANQLDNAQKASNNLSVSGKTEVGGVFQAQGEVILKPFSAALKTGFRGLPAKNIFPFFSTSPLLEDIKANLSGKGLFRLPTKSFVGELQLTDVSGRGPKTKPFSWQKSVFRNLNYTAEPFHIGISSANIEQARFTWEITKDDNGPMQYLANFCQTYLPTVDRRSSGKPSTTMSPVDIQEISFTDAQIDIHDRRLTPNWDATAFNFAGKIKDIHSGSTPGKSVFSFTGKLDDTPFDINGEIDPFALENNGAFHFSLENYPLASFQSQLSPMINVNPSNGKLNLTLDCTWQDRHYLSSGNLVLADVKPVDVTSESALPLALLTGDDNTFQLPFTFSRTEPVAKTTLFDELLTSFQRLVVKGAVSPLLLATGDFTDLIGNEYVEFSPGEFMLSESGQKVLIRYSALLKAHPHVGLILSGGIDKEIDRRAMKERLEATEQKRVDKKNEQLFKKWQEDKALYEKNLAEQQKIIGPDGKIVEQNIPSALLTQFTPLRPVPVVVDETMLLELAQKRINILIQYFTSQLALEPGRIEVLPPEENTADSESQTTGVTITLKAISQ